MNLFLDVTDRCVLRKWLMTMIFSTPKRTFFLKAVAMEQEHHLQFIYTCFFRVFPPSIVFGGLVPSNNYGMDAKWMVEDD